MIEFEEDYGNKAIIRFLENKKDDSKVLPEALCKEDINIASLPGRHFRIWLASNDCIRSREKAKKILKDMGFSAKLTNVIAVKIAQKLERFMRF